jgi:ABC-type Na+ efflux pump permease subunit
MAERRKAADDAEVAFYNEQIEDVKGTLATAKQMEAAASRGAARLEKRAATIEASPATPSKRVATQPLGGGEKTGIKLAVLLSMPLIGTVLLLLNP